MTGIEQLRKMGADAVRGGEVGRAICDIADQIERETEEQSARLYDERVGEETDVCGLFGVVPVDDPLTSLRRHVEGLNDTIENLRLELGEARDDAAWVREHGGIAYVKEEWNARSNLKRSLETAQAKVERQQRHIELVQGKCRERQERIAALNKTVAEMRPRLMPEGMTWPMVDGEPVDFVTGYEPSLGVLEAVSIYSNGACEVMGHDGIIKDVKEIHVATPKVLDADGMEIRVGDTVWTDYGDGPWTVTRITTANAWHVYGHGDELGSLDMPPSTLTHRAPILAADGRPLREGETVWHMPNKKFVKITGFTKNSLMRDVVDVEYEDGSTGRYAPNMLTHERSDSWERLEEDANDLIYDIGSHLGDYSPSCFNETGDSIQDRVRDLVRRAKALAGVSE